MRPLFVAAAVLTAAGSLQAAVIGVNTLNQSGNVYTYSQNFNGLTATVTSTNSVPWANETMVTDWLAQPKQNATDNGGFVPNPPNVAQGSGTSSTGRLYSFGTTNTSADRSLGAIVSDTSGGTDGANNGFYYGTRFVNNTSFVIKEVTLVYTGEQYRAAYNSTGGIADPRNNQIIPGYRIYTAGGPTSQIADTGYTSFTGATFNTPVDIPATGTASVALDGNLAANRVANLTSTESVTLLPGQEIWIRFFDSNSSGTDHGIGIDDLSLSFQIPEPGSLSLLAGLSTMMLRRRVAR